MTQLYRFVERSIEIRALYPGVHDRRRELPGKRAITPPEALPMLLQQVCRPMDAAAMARTLKRIDRLGCNRDIEAAQDAWRMMGT